ncbi:hypothetical protein [Wenyingzhuangia sp. 2_MG-2023]|uniref:hypothetical protein n=1 Tax=Wenyingzhuangia sp. 2_MG-2023 TaxID=3062639 RepID=UPI0026E29209|nr:hypothetical protein [Wenyingzhuangia sp. 2_MG-2023]
MDRAIKLFENKLENTIASFIHAFAVLGNDCQIVNTNKTAINVIAKIHNDESYFLTVLITLQDHINAN